MKLRKYYDKTDKPFTYVDATLLHPGLKKFIQKAGYDTDTVHNYIKQAETRYQKGYDPAHHHASRAQEDVHLHSEASVIVLPLQIQTPLME